jgi:hypothetical protein
MSDNINQIVNEKLDKNNFHAWKFRMTNFLMGKGFWDYVEGENEDPPKLLEENATTVEIKAFDALPSPLLNPFEGSTM